MHDDSNVAFPSRPQYDVEIEVTVRVRKNGQPYGKVDKRHHKVSGYLSPTNRVRFGDEMETMARDVLERLGNTHISRLLR